MLEFSFKFMYVECLKTSSNCGEVFEKKKYCISGHPKNVAHQLAFQKILHVSWPFMKCDLFILIK